VNLGEIEMGLLVPQGARCLPDASGSPGAPGMIRTKRGNDAVSNADPAPDPALPDAVQEDVRGFSRGRAFARWLAFEVRPHQRALRGPRKRTGI
jgi:hypothetical protein